MRKNDEADALELDREDPLHRFREQFHLPRGDDGEPSIYFCGNSLGLQPVSAAAAVEQQLEDWARLAVDGHFEARTPWYSYHERFRGPLARLVGAHESEVVAMNGLSVNLHLMMVSFYRPRGARCKILMEGCAFPSDTFAVKSQLRYHGHDPADALIVAGSGEEPVSEETIESLLERHRDEIALVLLGGVNYYTGQAFDLERITTAAKRCGVVVGLDLAHAAGNLVLQLHDWNVDFAVWCSYKYMNGGPGAIAGCFVHERHGKQPGLPRFAGWWGNDPGRRFRMHLDPEFEPFPGADGWQLSNPPILAMAPLGAALEIFDEAGIEALREKSVRLTGYLEAQIEATAHERVQLLTPRVARARGCQLSLRVRERARELFRAVKAAGVTADYREPDVIRVAPVPLYNTFHEVWRFGRILERWATAA